MRTRALIDLLIVIAGCAAVIFVGQSLGLPGPGSWMVLAGVLLSMWRLAAAGQDLAAVGLRSVSRWWMVALWVAVLYAAVVAANVLVVAPLARVSGWGALDVSRFAGLRGNARVLATYLALAWTSAAFGEEFLFRGFLLARIESALGGTLTASLAAIVIQAALFGAGHSYLGVRGAVTAAMVGLLFGIGFRVNGRQLIPLMIAHGLTDTVSLTAIYAGVHPS
jgi:membrane protease YdiL (CAAX protease family)